MKITLISMLFAFVFALVSALATLIGGLLPIYTRLREVGVRYLIGFASGFLISVAFLEMLPEIRPGTRIDFVSIALGFFSLYLIEKLVMIHACGEKECVAHTVKWVSVIGIAAESLIDGIAIAVGFMLNPAIGLTVALAVIVHEIPRGFTTSVIMKSANYTRNKLFGALAIDAGFTPLGVALVYLNLFPRDLFTPLLAFTAGTFIYIGASDLLPEAHRRFNIKVVATVILGALTVAALEFLTGI